MRLARLPNHSHPTPWVMLRHNFLGGTGGLELVRQEICCRITYETESTSRINVLHSRLREVSRTREQALSKRRQHLLWAACETTPRSHLFGLMGARTSSLLFLKDCE